MDLNESLFSRVKHKVTRPILSRSLSDSGPEEARDADGESSESGTPRRASYDSLLVPETPSPLLQRCKNKREREVQSSQGEEDSDSKRSRAMMKNFDRFISPFKPADLKNKEKKEAFEKLRLAREKRLAKIESDSDHEGEATTSPSANGYKYAHFGAGYLGWPSDSDSDSDDNDDDIPLRNILNEQRVKVADIGEVSDTNKTKSAIPKHMSIMRQIKGAAAPNPAQACVGPDLRFPSNAPDVRLKTEPVLQVGNSSTVDEPNLPEFVSPEAEGSQLCRDKNDVMNLGENQQSSSHSYDDGETFRSEDSKHLRLPVNRRRNLFPKKDSKVKNRPSLFENRSDVPRTNPQRLNSNNPLNLEPESRPSCRYAQSSSFRPASSLMNDKGGNCSAQVSTNESLLSANNDSVILCTPPVPRGGNSHVCSISESSFLNHLPSGGQKTTDRVEHPNLGRKNGLYSNHLSFNLPPRQEKDNQNTAEFVTPPQVRSDVNAKPNTIHTIDLTRSESPTFCSPLNLSQHPNGMHNACRFQTPTHDALRCDTNRVEPVQSVPLNMTGAQRSPSPDVIPLGVFNLSANRRPEFDLSVSPQQPMRNRTGSRRHNRVSGLRRNRIGNVSIDEGISPTTTRLMSEVSVSNHGNDADEAVSMVRQLEDDEQYARRLQEEMDKEFAMSLHQADAGFVQTDHAGAFGAEEAACPPALSPSFLQYCRSPVRRRGYNSNRQPINRRRRGAAAAEPEDLTTYEELLVDGPGYEHGARRFPPGANHPLALMEAHILALLDNSPVNRRRGRRGNNGGRFFRNLHSPVGDGNDYEELLELAESLGEVKQKGMTKSELNRLATRKYKCSEANREDTTDCLICMCDYQEGDKLRILPCCHEFHQPCIDKWLKNMATCPICRVDVKNN